MAAKIVVMCLKLPNSIPSNHVPGYLNFCDIGSPKLYFLCCLPFALPLYLHLLFAFQKLFHADSCELSVPLFLSLICVMSKCIVNFFGRPHLLCSVLCLSKQKIVASRFCTSIYSHIFCHCASCGYSLPPINKNSGVTFNG